MRDGRLTAERTKPPRKGHIGYDSWTAYLYILPSFLLFFLFVFYPFGNTLYMSLHTTDPNGVITSFEGLGNFRTILTSKDFHLALRVTLELALMVVLGSIGISLILAILANESFPGRALFRTIFSMPMAVSSACISVIALFILNPTTGILNYLLDTNIRWLTDVRYALKTVAAVTIWMNLGLNFIFLIAALQSVDASLYEAASIEGAGFFRKHFHVTLPGISPTLFFLFIINIIGSFQVYAQINLLTSGGPGKFTQNIVYSIYLEAFRYNRFGMASAQSVVLFVLIFLLTLLQFKLEKKVTY